MNIVLCKKMLYMQAGSTTVFKISVQMSFVTKMISVAESDFFRRKEGRIAKCKFFHLSYELDLHIYRFTASVNSKNSASFH